jgi:hypothetical protein
VQRVTTECGCVVEWGDEWTKLLMCGEHSLQRCLWDGTVEEFVLTVSNEGVRLLKSNRYLCDLQQWLMQDHGCQQTFINKLAFYIAD